MKHVLFLMGALNRGGTEILLLHCFKQQQAAKLKMSLIHRKEGSLQKSFYEHAANAKQLRLRFAFDPFYFYKLRKQIKVLKLDIIHAMQPLDLVYAALASLNLKIPLVLTLHGFPDEKKSFYEQLLLKLSVKFSSQLLFVSKFQQSWYQQAYNLPVSKLTSLYNGVDFSVFGKKKLKEIQKPDKIWKFGSVGNFTPVRNPIVLCKLALLMHHEGIDFTLELVGIQDPKHPELYNNCVEFVKSNDLTHRVFFMGSRSDVPDLLLSWDAFLYATNHDTFGLALVEAMGVGLPVFVNDWPVMQEITRNGELGHVYETGNIASLYQKMSEFFTNYSLYQENAIENIIVVREIYGIEKHLLFLNQQYNQLFKN
jgi:glycosyltransferase involved in cell wall biosynthesis